MEEGQADSYEWGVGRCQPEKQKTLPPFGGQGCFFGL